MNRCYIAIVLGGRTRLHRADTDLFELLLVGPTSVDHVTSLPEVDTLPRRVHAGWIADFDAKRVVLYHKERGAVLLPRIHRLVEMYDGWAGFEVRWTTDEAGGLGAYLAGDEGGLFAERSERPPQDALSEPLWEKEAAQRRANPEPRMGAMKTSLFLLAVLLVVVTLGPFAVLVRLATAPFRGRLGRHFAAVADAQRKALKESNRRTIEAEPFSVNPIDLRFKAGQIALLAEARWVAAEAAFDECVRRIEAGDKADQVTLARSLYCRGLAREQLSLRALAQVDLQRAEALDPTVAPSPSGAGRWLLHITGRLVRLFREAAGLLPDR